MLRKPTQNLKHCGDHALFRISDHEGGLFRTTPSPSMGTSSAPRSTKAFDAFEPPGSIPAFDLSALRYTDDRSGPA